MLSTIFGFSQEAYYQTMEAQIKINARRYNNVYQWENKNITVTIDYKTGDFLLRLTNNDFRETMGELQMEITRPGQGNGNFRLFVITGKLKTDEIQIPSFNNYDNEIDLTIIFKGITVN